MIVSELAGRSGPRIVGTGVPLPPGALAAGRRVTLGGVPAQWKALCRHGDGSPAWVHVRAPLEIRPFETRTLLLREESPSAAREPLGSAANAGPGLPAPVSAAEGPDGVWISGGGFSLHCPRRGGVLAADVRSADGPGRPWSLLLGGAGPAELVSLDVDERGPWFAAVRSEHLVATAADGPVLRLAARISVEAGSAAVILSMQAFSDDFDGALPPLEVVIPEGRTATVVRAAGGPFLRERAESLAIVQPRPSEAWLEVDGRSARAIRPPETGGRFRIEGPDFRMTVRIPDFALRAPRSLLVDGAGLRLRFLDEGFPWRAGTAHRVDVVLSVGGDDDAGGVPRLEGWDVLARPSPATLVAAGFLRLPRPPFGGGRFEGLEELVVEEARRLPEERTRFGVTGAADHGDWLLTWNDFGNLEYDTILGFLARALFHGEAWAFREAWDMAVHLLDRDIDRARTGLPLRHGPWHRGGGVEVGHVWVEGLLHLYHVTADPFLLAGIEEIRRGLLGALARDELPNPRSVGWGLRALSALFRHFRSRGERAALADLVAGVRKSRLPGGHLCPDPAPPGERSCAVTPWVTAGIVIDGLDAARVVLDDGRIRSLMAEAAAALCRDAIEGPDGLCDKIVLDRRSGRRLGRRGRASGEEMAFFLVGLARASGSGRLPGAAEGLRAAIVPRLRIRGKEMRGKELSQLLLTVPVLESLLPE